VYYVFLSRCYFYYVDTRNIRILPGETKRKNRYNYEDIIRVKKELGIDEEAPAIIDWVGPADVTSTVALDFLAYQETIIADLNHYVSWVRKNPHISLAAFDAKDRRTVLAYVALLPLPETTILEMLSGKRNEMDIQPEEIESYERPGGYTLLVESAVSHPDHPEKLGVVLKGLMDYWCEQYPQRYIDKIYAQSVSDEGDILIQKLYFAARYDIAETAYMLDLKRPGASRLIKRFQECLKTKIKDQQ
jgi:hypothetical protein